MNTCDTCKYWKPPEDVLRGGDKPVMTTTFFGTCSNPTLQSVDMVVVKKRIRKYKSAPRLDGACADFEWGYLLSTGPKFGCVHWEAE